MKSIDFIISELRELHRYINSSSIKYEYDNFLETHLIEVKPIDVYNSIEYIELELALEKTFFGKFPNEEILFISEDSLNKITNPIYEIEGCKGDEYGL